MKLVTFERGGDARLGLVTDDDHVLDLSLIGGGERFPKTMLDLVFEAKRSLPLLAELARGRNGFRYALDSVRLLAPIPRPLKNVFCVGRNYAAHAAEGARAQGREVVVPEFPEFFTKPPTAVTGHEAAVPLDPAVTAKFDYEVELGVVIGTGGKDIPRDRAFEHVFGYTIVNDLTARDLQRRHGQWFKGKGLDASCPMGPWIVTRDALPNAADLGIRLRVNGETRQQSRTSRMVHDIPAIIEHLSRGMTLEPGDVIATGTPEGVGYAMDPPRFLTAGDVVEAEIDGIGILRNRIQ
jgi:2-keto-4-pentenoate hydratase/2-oxohepta-3-ene-1,7-dioic acid hydratase in catechol pathway